MRYRGVPFRGYEHAFPAQVGTALVVDSRQSGPLHQARFVASRRARFTATLARCTLYSFWLRGLAPSTAALPAWTATSSLRVLPARKLPADAASHGVGAT